MNRIALSWWVMPGDEGSKRIRQPKLEDLRISKRSRRSESIAKAKAEGALWISLGGGGRGVLVDWERISLDLWLCSSL